MAAPPLQNDFNGGVNGSTIATANTGSGNAWNTVTIGASATVTYDDAQTHSGGLSMKIVEPGTAVSCSVIWTGLGTITTDVWSRLYLYITANPGTTWQGLMNYRTATAALCAQLGINTTGKLVGYNAAAGAIATGTVSISLNQWVRVEWRVVPSTTVGQLEWRLFNTADSIVADETVNTGSLVLGANIDEVRHGIVTTPAPASYTAWFDDVAVRKDNWIGPSGNSSYKLTP